MTIALPSEDLNTMLDALADPMAELRGERIFLTGGTGFFGKWLLESFLRANHQLSLGARITVLTRDAAGFRARAPHLARLPSVELLEGDVKTFDFPPGSFSHVIHAATEASAKLNTEAPLEMVETIVAGMRRTLDFAAQAGTTRFLFTSSGAVYGRQPAAMTHVREDFSGAPDCLDVASAYAEGKRVAELLGVIDSKRCGFQFKLARCFAFVGPHLPLDAHFAIGNFLRDALAGGTVRVSGDGSPYRSYLYAADLAVWLWTILLRGASGRAYNVGSDEGLSIAALAHLVAREVTSTPTVTVVGAPLGYDPAVSPPPAGHEVARYVPNVQRARTELGLEIRIPLVEAVRRTRDWYRRSHH